MTIGPIHGRSLWAELKAYAGSRGSTFLAAAVIIAGQAWLVNSLAFRPAWVFPVLSTVLLLGSAVAFRSDRKEPSVQMRWLARGVVGVLALANAVCIAGPRRLPRFGPFTAGAAPRRRGALGCEHRGVRIGLP